MNAPAIRVAAPADADALTAFNIAMALETEQLQLLPAVVGAGVRRVLGDPTLGFYLIAEQAAQPVGGLLVTSEWSDWRNGRFWWIQSVYVVPAHRRQGVYRALHDHVREQARGDPQACGLRLYVERENTGAMATYRALGMHETDYRLYEEEF